MSILNHQKNLKNLVKNIAPSTSRTENTRRHKRGVWKQNFWSDGQKHKDNTENLNKSERGYEQYMCLQNSHFTTLNNHNKTLSKHDENTLKLQRRLTDKSTTSTNSKTIEQTPKIRPSTKNDSFGSTNYLTKSLHQGNILYSYLYVMWMYRHENKL